MKNGWTLHVENFGKIKKADIEVTPFTLFIGDNNSGKSYLLSLIWGLLNLDVPTIDSALTESNSQYYLKCIRWIDEFSNNVLNGREVGYTLYMKEEMLSNFNGLINDILDSRRQKIMASIFSHNVNIEKLSVSLSTSENLYLRLNKIIEKDSFKKDVIVEFRKSRFYHSIENLNKFNNQILLIWLIKKMLEIEVEYKSNEIIAFLPASRTGFLLTYKMLASKAIENVFNTIAVEKNTTLTKPISSFLSRLAKISTNVNEDLLERDKKLNEIAVFMEERILGGKVDLINLPTISDIKYRPNGCDHDLPLYLTSSVVTELTPLTLFLKYQKDFQILMMEEPEISLHPKLQWLMARVLIKLSNTGMPVFITTHSDTILQHVNNMIKLQGNSNKEELMMKYGYNEDDLISLAHISMYQFDVDEETETTSVTKLEASKNGFAIPSFEKTLKELLEEVWNFQEED